MMAENTIESMAQEGLSFPPPENFTSAAHIRSMDEYEMKYLESIENPEAFWAREAESLNWFKKWDNVLEYDFNKPEIKWFAGGKLNASYNCLDRHLTNGRRNKAALIWEGDPGDCQTFTYQQLHREVCRFANVLKKHNVKKGDRVTIYLPMIPELAIAMLACARIGAIHSIVFGGFSAVSLRDRILDADSHFLITSDAGYRGGRIVELKANADEAISECPNVRACIVVRRVHTTIDMEPGRDYWWHEEMAADDISSICEPEEMDAEDPLFILYTSGSTGKPKGVLHTTGGYMLFTAMTHKYIFDIKDDDVYWCTADIGWITGHSYIVYGPLANGTTSLMFEGVPNYPKPDRFWEVVDKFGVNVFYTAPTAIRAMMRDGEEWPAKHDMSSLRLLGSVGEPINPEAWLWYHRNIGRNRCPIVDTWWQTETGGILITPLAGAMTLKPGSANRPFFGVKPKVVREDGSEASVNEGGYLLITEPWPGMIRGVYGDPENKRIKEVYFERFPGNYMTGDGARVDEDGDYWLMGRIDDVINVSGHRIGTAEVESALVSHEAVAEAAVVGFPHEVKGEGIYAYVTLKSGVNASDDLRSVLVGHVSLEIGPIAKPDKVHFTPGLPKTRSGKIMRRILRKVAAGQIEDVGDTTTLADPSVVETIIAERQ